MVRWFEESDRLLGVNLVFPKAIADCQDRALDDQIIYLAISWLY